MSRLQKLIVTLLMIVVIGLGLLAAAIWQVAALREPDSSGTIGEERSIGFFDPHLHVRLLEVVDLEPLPDTQPAPPGYRHRWIRLEVRSSAVELLMDPSQLSVSLRFGFAQWAPLKPVAGRLSIDGIPVVQHFSGPLRTEASEQAWFVFELPEDLTDAELWVSRDSWLIRILPELEATPLHDKAVYAVPLHPHR